MWKETHTTCTVFSNITFQSFSQLLFFCWRPGYHSCSSNFCLELNTAGMDEDLSLGRANKHRKTARDAAFRLRIEPYRRSSRQGGCEHAPQLSVFRDVLTPRLGSFRPVQGDARHWLCLTRRPQLRLGGRGRRKGGRLPNVCKKSWWLGPLWHTGRRRESAGIGTDQMPRVWSLCLETGRFHCRDTTDGVTMRSVRLRRETADGVAVRSIRPRPFHGSSCEK